MHHNENTQQKAAGSQNSSKSIEFYMCASHAIKRGLSIGTGYTGKLERFDVDLSSLSLLARGMAEAIQTTDRRDDLSRVLVQSNRWLETDIPRFRMTGVLPGTPEHATLCTRWNIEPVPCSWFYSAWDSLRPSETPEQYFERHAAEALDNGEYGQDDLSVLGGW
jgi:hypothetical protein